MQNLHFVNRVQSLKYKIIIHVLFPNQRNGATIGGAQETDGYDYTRGHNNAFNDETTFFTLCYLYRITSKNMICYKKHKKRPRKLARSLFSFLVGDGHHNGRLLYENSDLLIHISPYY